MRVGDNRLPALAADIRKAHADVQGAAKTAAQRAIEAGHALMEAKALVEHGGWLPWLREHCALAERTAQLYMKIAKSGNSPEIIAALGLQGAATEIVQFVDEDYDPFFHCTERGKHEWQLFVLFLSRECSWYPEGAEAHVEYLCQKQFTSPDDWLTGGGAKWRKQWCMREPGEGFFESWRCFLNSNSHLVVDNITCALSDIAKSVGPMPAGPSKKRRRRKPQRLRISGAT